MPPSSGYTQFARSYIGRWADRKSVMEGLTKIHDEGFDYEDHVALANKHHLAETKASLQVMDDTFEILFNNTDAKFNSDCIGAIEDYLRVFFCERGFAHSYDEARDMLGESTTEFPGLLQQTSEEDPRELAKKAEEASKKRAKQEINELIFDSPRSQEYKAAFVSIKASTDKLPEIMEAANKALNALIEEVQMTYAADRAATKEKPRKKS